MDKPFNPSNLTGVQDSQSAIANLIVLSMRLNNFREVLNESSFAGMRNAKTISLSNSNIFSIGPKTFDAMKDSIEFIDLRGNYLKVLPVDFFDGIAQRYQVNIFLSENPWNCLCDLLDLKQTMMKHRIVFSDFDRVKCASPEPFADKVVGRSEFCVRPTEKPAITDDFIEIDCENCNRKIFVPRKQFSFSVRGDSKSSKIIVEINEINNDLAMVITKFPAKYSGNLFDARKNSICFTKLELKMSIAVERTAESSGFYEICIFNKQVATKSPFDCHNLRFSSTERSSNYLISNGSHDTLFTFTAVGAICCVIFISIFFGVVIAYIITRFSKATPETNVTSNELELERRRSSDMSFVSDRTSDNFPLNAYLSKFTRTSRIHSYTCENTSTSPQRRKPSTNLN